MGGGEAVFRTFLTRAREGLEADFGFRAVRRGAAFFLRGREAMDTLYVGMTDRPILAEGRYQLSAISWQVNLNKR